MSMLSSLMSNVMSSARASRHSGSGNGSTKEDPIAKEERTAYRKLMEGYIKDGNVKAASRLLDQPPEGVNPTPYAAVLGVKTKKQKEVEQVNSLLSQVVMQALGGGTQQPAQPSTYTPNTFTTEYPSSKPAEGPRPMPAQPAAPSQTTGMKRRGPRLSITSITRNADGGVSFTVGDKRTDGEKYIDKLVDAERLTPDEADAQKAALAELQLHDLMSDVESIQSYKDDKGQLYTHIMFKNGESRVKKAVGPKLQVKEEEKEETPPPKKWVWDMKENMTALVTDEKASADPKRYQSMDSPAAKAAMPNSTLQTMQQTAPHVIGLLDQADSSLKAAGEIGPTKGRWRNLWTGKVGTKDPNFMKLKVDTDLLMTLLMRMHVGARGGEYILAHFKEMLDAGKQSPENLQTAFDEIRRYAYDIMQPAYGLQGLPNAPQIAPGGTTATLPIGTKMADGTVLKEPKTITSDGKGGWN